MKTIKELLDDLGKTAGEVLRKLDSLGIKGSPASPCDCPVAKYLQGNGHPHATVCSRYTRPNSWDRGVNHPEPVTLFIQGFDGGLFPELIG